MSEQALRQQLVEVCHLLYHRGYVAGHDGNVSCLLEGGRVLVTPSGVCKGRITAERLVICDLEGKALSGWGHPSSETAMHLAVYRTCPTAQAVVHAHPPAATAFAVCRRGLEIPYLTETVSGLGPVPVAPYALPSTEEVPRSVEPFLPRHTAILLANHGALTWGEDLWQAFDRMETVEHTAKIYAQVQALGGGVPLTEEQVSALRALEGRYRVLAGPREEHQP